jgi:lysophospholipase L1-like esterase
VKRRGRALSAAGVLFGALALVAALELGLRLLTDQSSKWNVRLGAGKQFDPVTRFRNQPHYRFSSGVTTNERGYLAPQGLAPDLPPDRLRLVYLGDSVSFLPVHANYPQQVEAILETERGVPVETVNTAVPGFASENVRALFESEVARLDADYLFVHVGWNDLGQYGPEGLPYKRRDAGYELSPLQRVLTRSYSVRLVYALQRVVASWQPALDEPLSAREQELYERYAPGHFVENVRAILDLGRSRYPNVALMKLATLTSGDPTPDELRRAHFPVGMGKNVRKLDRLVRSYNDAIEALARETGVTLIDLHAVFASHEAKRHFTDSCHVDAAGAELMARAVVRAMEPSLPAGRARLELRPPDPRPRAGASRRPLRARAAGARRARARRTGPDTRA